MKKLKLDKGIWLLIFLSCFGLAIGVFDNYRDLWMSSNGLSALTISHIKSISNIVTVLSLFYFTLKVSVNNLKNGISLTLIGKMLVEVLLLLLNQTTNIFLIKFLMFFDIAFTKLILSAIYPLMMNFAKNDELYAKKKFAESFFDNLGFFIVSILVGKIIFNYQINYNTCLFLSLVFTFISFAIFSSIKMPNSKNNYVLNIPKTIKYFTSNKIFLFFLGFDLLCSLVYSSVLGMPLLTLTKNLNFNSQTASFLVLGMGIISNFMAIIILKFLRFKNDQINLIFKYGIRVILYILTLVSGRPELLITTIIYMLLTDVTYEFIFSSYFINKIDTEYSLIFTTLKYCASLFGKAIGVYICGLVFNLNISLIVLPAALLGITQYILATILIQKKKQIK